MSSFSIKHLIIGLLLAAPSLAADRPTKPNVVLILTDDLGWQDSTQFKNIDVQKS